MDDNLPNWDQDPTTSTVALYLGLGYLLIFGIIGLTSFIVGVTHGA